MNAFYDAEIIFRNNKYEPVIIRKYTVMSQVGSLMIFFLEGENTVGYHQDDIHEINTKPHEE